MELHHWGSRCPIVLRPFHLQPMSQFSLVAEFSLRQKEGDPCGCGSKSPAGAKSEIDQRRGVLPAAGSRAKHLGRATEPPWEFRPAGTALFVLTRPARRRLFVWMALTLTVPSSAAPSPWAFSLWCQYKRNLMTDSTGSPGFESGQSSK